MLAALFVVTGICSRSFHQKEAAIAKNWFTKGNAALAAGKSREARDDFRNALIFEPQNPDYQLHLAEALAAYGQPEQARTYLVNLLSQNPADGQVNLDLARLAARDDRISDAIHYYHGAIYGFADNPTDGLNARVEFAEFLVDVGDNSQAGGELTALSANVPALAAAIQSRIGNLFERAGYLRAALNEYEVAVRTDESPVNLEKAGSTAYRLGEFRLADTYLARLPQTYAGADSIKIMLQTSQAIDAIDPLAPNLSNAERAHRTASALEQLITRVAACVGHQPAKGSEDLRSSIDRARYMRNSEWSERSLLENPDRVRPAIQYVFDLEAKTDQICGPAQGPDLPLSLLPRSHASSPLNAPATSSSPLGNLPGASPRTSQGSSPNAAKGPPGS